MDQIKNLCHKPLLVLASCGIADMGGARIFAVWGQHGGRAGIEESKRKAYV